MKTSITINQVLSCNTTNRLKRIALVCLAFVMAGCAFPCAIPGTHNYYLFSVLQPQDWQDRVYQQTLDNWQAYANGEKMDWFDADVLRTVAKKKSDVLMVHYLDHLTAYLNVVQEAKASWEYPSKLEVQQYQKELERIRDYALSNTNGTLRSQHALLYMRCNMMLEQHQENIRFWEQKASKYIRSVYREMMRNIYAGALLKTGKVDAATAIYAEQGDVSGLYTYYYKKRSYEAIKDEYEAHPDSPSFPFLLQDFANNAQETYDALRDEENWPGKLFIRDIKKKECKQMCELADRVVREGKNKNPILWQSLKAWLLYLQGNRKEALTTIQETANMKGMPRAIDNARVLQLFISASVNPVGGSYNNFLVGELEWLEQKANEERGSDTFFDNHYTQVFDRLVHQVLFPKYQSAGREELAIAFLAVDDRRWYSNYTGHCFAHLDTTSICQVVKYYNFTRRQPRTKLSKWLHNRISRNDTLMHELLGTKYLRCARWREAIAHLELVPLSYINTMNIAPFMGQRDFRVEPWMKRQFIPEERQLPGKASARNNQKLQYAREMLSLTQGLNQLPLRWKALRCYLIASRYAQASYAGDAWYLTRYGKSCYDKHRSDEVDMLRRASRLLLVAQKQKTFADKEKALFGRAWLPVDSWYRNEWNDQCLDYEMVLQPHAHQYQSLEALSAFERQNSSLTSKYVSRCDVLQQFLRYQSSR